MNENESTAQGRHHYRHPTQLFTTVCYDPARDEEGDDAV